MYLKNLSLHYSPNPNPATPKLSGSMLGTHLTQVDNTAPKSMIMYRKKRNAIEINVQLWIIVESTLLDKRQKI